jgi:hypothetical protein
MTQQNSEMNSSLQTNLDPPSDLLEMREVYTQLKRLSQSDNPLVQDAGVLMLAIAHDVLRHIDVENPPEHIADYE